MALIVVNEKNKLQINRKFKKIRFIKLQKEYMLMNQKRFLYILKIFLKLFKSEEQYILNLQLNTKTT